DFASLVAAHAVGNRDKDLALAGAVRLDNEQGVLITRSHAADIGCPPNVHQPGNKAYRMASRGSPPGECGRVCWHRCRKANGRWITRGTACAQSQPALNFEWVPLAAHRQSPKIATARR